MKKNKILNTILVSALLVPNISFAALDGVKGLLQEFAKILNLVVPVLFGLSLVYFFWGVGQFILRDAGNEKTREEGKKKIIWGIIALFVFVSIYGILGAIGDAVGIDVPVSTESGYLTPEQGGWTLPVFGN
jgi:uncharacterized membrane-anchored protein